MLWSDRLYQYRKYVLHAILLVLAIASIVYASPTRQGFPYQYQAGKLWKYKDLHAQTNFTIQKTEEELQTEKENIKKNCPIFFTRNTAVASNTLQRIKELAKSTVIPTEKLNKIEEIINTNYEIGVIQMPDNSRTYFMEIKGGDWEKKHIGMVKTTQYVTEELKPILANSPQLLEEITKEISPNLIPNTQLEEEYLEEELKSALPYKQFIAKGQQLITANEKVTSTKLQLLESYKKAYIETFTAHSSWSILGEIMLVSIALIVLFWFIYLIRPDLFATFPQFSMIVVWLVIMVVGANILYNYSPTYIYYYPFVIYAIILRTFFDSRIALFSYMIMLLIVAGLVPNPYNFIFTEFFGAVVGLVTLVNLKHRSQLLITVVMVLLVEEICYIAIQLATTSNWEELSLYDFNYFIVSALLILIVYPLIFITEKVFNLISEVTLLELCDLNTPILRELSLQAPGTFQHSLQVANLAEAAAYKIDANALLVRTGALYHDIGKIENSHYFIENQITGINPHEDLSYEQSAKLIISHVIKGIEKARKYKLPEAIIDFIRTHHGESTVQYFYRSYLKSFPEGLVDVSDFMYPGPKPFSKETAILMMADSVEAASRSLKQIDVQSIHNLVENIINTQIEDEQFVNAPITFRDITVIKKIFKRMLANMYHIRISYPK